MTEHASAGVPSESAQTPPARQGGPLVPFSQTTPTVPDGKRRERTVHAAVPRPAKTTLTANPNRTKAPPRQEVNR